MVRGFEIGAQDSCFSRVDHSPVPNAGEKDYRKRALLAIYLAHEFRFA